ncbi:Protein FAM57B [Channa argus]|uniref:Protein FAM57B n=1 Tax=Channa argus TaxID=215402 RepID=A0A6G1QPR1_CHAAH|nr:Protein FAM57B [Channa argus]
MSDRSPETMLTILAAGSVFFPGLFLLSKQCLKSIPALRWSEGDAVIVSARLVSSVQAVMASSAGYIISSSCKDIIEDQHWLTSSYILFAVPYFVYDIYAMFMCYWYKLRVKGHEEASAAPQHMSSAVTSYLRREFLMVLHHVVMVTVCFPVSVFWRQGKGDYFQGIMFMAELSTPSVCLGKILIQYKQQHTLLHKVNGALMLITFFICRVLLFPYLYYVYGRYVFLSISVFSCFCCLAELGSVHLYSNIVSMIWKYGSECVYNPSCPGTRPYPSTWFPSQCPGTVILVLLCSWHPSSIGSP